MKEIVTLRVTRVIDGQLLRNVRVEYNVALQYLIRNEDNEQLIIIISE